jgi:hypothetical protein
MRHVTETGFMMVVIAVAAVCGAAAAPPSKAPEKSAELTLDFGSEVVGAAPKSVTPVVGNWRIGEDGDNRVLVVDGRHWKQGQTAAGIADRARSLYGERYAEFLDNVKAFAYYPYVVVNGCDDFQQGEIVMRFKTIEGKIDQGAGILFNLKPNGDYLALRANPLENNLVLWQFVHGKRTSVKWVRDVPTTSREWHELKLVVKGSNVQGFLDGKSILTHKLPAPVAGRVGIWSKADSVVDFDDYTIRPAR